MTIFFSVIPSLSRNLINKKAVVFISAAFSIGRVASISQYKRIALLSVGYYLQICGNYAIIDVWQK